MILETPREVAEGEDMDRVNLRRHSGDWPSESGPPLVDHARKDRYIETGRQISGLHRSIGRVERVSRAKGPAARRSCE